MNIDMSIKPEVKGFFDPATNTISYVVTDPASTACAIAGDCAMARMARTMAAGSGLRCGSNDMCGSPGM